MPYYRRRYRRRFRRRYRRRRIRRRFRRRGIRRMPLAGPDKVIVPFRTMYTWTPTDLSGKFTGLMYANDLSNPFGTISSNTPARWAAWQGIYEKYYVYKARYTFQFVFAIAHENFIVVAYPTTETGYGSTTSANIEKFGAKWIHMQGGNSGIHAHTLRKTVRMKKLFARDLQSINVSGTNSTSPSVLGYLRVFGDAVDGSVNNITVYCICVQHAVLYRAYDN